MFGLFMCLCLGDWFCLPFVLLCCLVLEALCGFLFCVFWLRLY